MKNMKRLTALLLSAVMLAGTLAACGNNGSSNNSGSESGSTKYADTVVVTYADDLDSTNPYGSTSSSCHFYTNSTHDVLIKNDWETGEIVGVLAESWDDVNGDGTAWRLHLRKEVKFHDGTDFTSEDVVFTWNWAKDPANVVKPINSADQQVKEIIAEDDYTVLFNMNYAIPDFPSYLELKMLSKDAFDNNEVAKAAEIGTGPYKVGEIISGVSYSMTRFEEYWGGTEQFHTKNIVVKYIPDLNTAAAALQKGEVDYTFILNNSSYYEIDANPDINITKAQGCMSYYIGINSRKEIWQNVEMRRALAMAINKEDIVNIQFENGIGATVNNNFCVPSGAGYTDIKVLEHNVEEAGNIVKNNNATGTKVVIMASAAYKAMAEVVQANLNAIGLEAQIDFVDSTNWTTLKSTYDYDVFVGDYASYTGALLYNFNRFFTVGGSSNLFGFENAEWESMMKDIQKCTTYDEMLTQFAGMQQWVVDNVPLIPIAVNNAFGYAREGVGGVKVAPSYNLQELHWLYKIEE